MNLKLVINTLLVLLFSKKIFADENLELSIYHSQLKNRFYLSKKQTLDHIELVFKKDHKNVNFFLEEGGFRQLIRLLKSERRSLIRKSARILTYVTTCTKKNGEVVYQFPEVVEYLRNKKLKQKLINILHDMYYRRLIITRIDVMQSFGDAYLELASVLVNLAVEEYDMRIPRESWFDDDEFNFFYWVEQSLSSLEKRRKIINSHETNQ